MKTGRMKFFKDFPGSPKSLVDRLWRVMMTGPTRRLRVRGTPAPGLADPAFVAMAENHRERAGAGDPGGGPVPERAGARPGLRSDTVTDVTRGFPSR